MMNMIRKFYSVLIVWPLWLFLVNGFSRPKFSLTHTKLREPIGFTITTTMDWVMEKDEEIIFSLPRFTTSVTTDGKNIPGNDIPYGGVKLYPSLIFTASWKEGSIYDADGPFATSELRIKLKPAAAAPSASYVLELTIYDTAGLQVYCGFPDSHSVDLGRMRTHVPIFYTNSSYNALRGRTLMDMKNYSPFTEYVQMGDGCLEFNDCNHNGDCDYCLNKCNCRESFGNQTSDRPLIGTGLGIDCKLRMCPHGRAFADLPVNANNAHLPVECSNAGICNRGKAECECFDGFEGAACDFKSCPNDCSGHGTCLSMRELSLKYEGQPAVLRNYEYGSASAVDTTAWDAEMIGVCLCDSSWPIGLGPNERQLAEWFGADCSQKHCPSGDDPFTHIDEEQCHQLSQYDGSKFGLNQMIEPDLTLEHKGAQGNLCHIDCSNRGICNHKTGTCMCFEGSFGENCDGRTNTGGKDAN